jgi:hypothetical protein
MAISVTLEFTLATLHARCTRIEGLVPVGVPAPVTFPTGTGDSTRSHVLYMCLYVTCQGINADEPDQQ